MWRRLRALGKSKHKRTTQSRLNTESLEQRVLLAADAVGGEVIVASASTPATDSELSAAEIVFGANGETFTISHSAEVVGSRAAGDDREIFIRRFDADGALIGDPVLANQITRGEQSNPVVASNADGTLLAVWSGRGAGDRHGIFARRFNADGTAAGDQFRINTTRGGEQTMPDVAMASDGSAIVTWHGVGDGDVSGVFAQRIGADDALLGDETLVNTTVDGVQGYSSIGIDENGDYVIAWSSRNQDGDDWGIFAQRFNADGTTAGDEFAVNSTTEGSQHQASVDRAADGRFTIAWSSFAQDGDSWGVFAQQFDFDGTTTADEFQVNEAAAGHQMDPSVAVSGGGDLFVAWSDGVDDGTGWEVNARTFDTQGVVDGDVVVVNQDTNGASSGHQRNPSIALDDSGSAVILFQGTGGTTTNGIVQQRFEVDVVPAENTKPTLEIVNDPPGGAPFAISVGDTLEVTVMAQDPNSRDTLSYRLSPEDGTPADATITRVDNNTAIVRWTPELEDRGTIVPFRVLVADDGDPSLEEAVQFEAEVVNAVPVLDLNGGDTGIDTVVQFPEDATSVSLLDSSLSLSDSDNTELVSARAALRFFPDLNSESLSVDTTGTNITATYTAGSGRLELVGNDSVANYERVLESLVYENTAMPIDGAARFVEITVNDDTDNSAEATITLQISENEEPNIEPFRPITLVAGSPLHIPLNGKDADGDTLTYTVTSSNEALVMPTVLEGNRSWRVSVEGSGANAGIQGDMVFEFFEGRAPRATQRFIDLTNDDFYTGIIFHRVVDGFVIQGGDPTGTGSGGSILGDFDDQFHVDLQHNTTGLLSMAKTLDDTNDSQFFVTEGPQRALDYQHTIFGLLVEGEDIREAISNVSQTSQRPNDPITITDAEVFVDNQNGVLVLSAPEGMTGDVQVTVTVSDGNGGTDSTTMSVNIIEDPINSQPFLRDIPTITTETDVPAAFQLLAEDVEGDAVVFFDADDIAATRDMLGGGFGSTIPLVSTDPDLVVEVDRNTGLLTITPQNGLTGTHQILVAAAASNTPPQAANGSFQIDYQVIDVVINDTL